ncbi:MAG: L-fucose:H+ symporter permease [Bacteroidales bacterium]|nr:L-fucose:H+ symporter permease [Bacteroidales bacterium]
MEPTTTQRYRLPFLIITTLFFLWGFAHSILDVLNKHFQTAFAIGKAESAMVQAVVYGGYFLMAIPAGLIITRWGYRAGVIMGLCLYGVGALLFIPGATINAFWFFLFSLFIIGCGLTCLETAANPYVTVLGAPESSERRLNIAQSLNGLGWILGPLIGGLFVFADENGYGTGEADSLTIPYAVLGLVVLVVGFVFSRISLPEIDDSSTYETETTCETRPLLRRPIFVLGVVALFCYVAAQTGINSFFINYVEHPSIGLTPKDAAIALSFGGMGLFLLGRIGGSWLMTCVKPHRLLALFALGAVLCMAVVVANWGTISAAALFLCYLFESIMFPTLFALALRHAQGYTKLASSALIMSIVGGALAPILMGRIADATGSMAIGFVVPLACFMVIGIYAVSIYREPQYT